MKLLQAKNGFITHPVWLFVFGVLVGLILVILWAKGIIAVNNSFVCGG